MTKIFGRIEYILIFMISIGITKFVYIGDSYNIFRGILIVSSSISCILENKLMNKNLFIATIFWISSVTLCFLFILEISNIA